MRSNVLWASAQAIDGRADPATLAGVNTVLGTINGLYTVYTRIFLYDRNGVIIASTGETVDAGILGSTIGADCLAQVLRLRDPQQYHVSPFAESSS